MDIDGERLLHRLRTLATIGRDPAGGISRPGFGDATAQANRYVQKAAEQHNLCTAIDAGGNLLIRRPTSQAQQKRRTLLMGSHLDTVYNGGWLDGAYGVLSALEVLATIAEHDVDLGFDLTVVAFANEEGADFPQPFWGSMVLSGQRDALPAQPVDYQGNPLASALARTGGDINDLVSAAWKPDALLGYLELHIEQGPVLENSGTPIGVVDAINGRFVLQVDLHGTAAHAGTMPMEGRADALVAAAHLILAVRQLPREGRCQVATVGHLEVLPNSANTIAGTARLTVDLRDADVDRLRQAHRDVCDEAQTLADRLGVQARCEQIIATRPAATAPSYQAAITESADALGLAHTTLSSGAGHDAQIMAAVTPIGMIFVPSIGGASHVPQEDTAVGDLLAGARVLLSSVLRLTT
ncbi:Zn-dependent hydrolase [Streptomyces sp. NPDC056061]|uniref:Zn-dependent hydrolase n=1 Tax=Streptomyces sp. NPDC056061 TaxID=3345700 RepID=UPI0035D84B9D